MSIFSIQKDSQRIGEVVVAGPSVTLQKRLITHLCHEVVLTSNNTVFGRSKITDELQLFYYGIGEKENYADFAWDIIAPKMLGYVLVFNWYDGNAFQEIQHLADKLWHKVDCHGIVVGDVADSFLTLDSRIYEHGFSLSSKVHFTMWDSSVKSSAKHVMKILVESIINHLD